MRQKKALAAAIVAVGLAVSSAASAAPLWEFTTPGNSFSNGSWDFATAFTVTSDISATGLGYYADPNNGFVDANEVALYQCDNADCTSTATLIASAIVDNTYPLFGHFRYVTIAPVLLQAGMSYEVAGVSHGNNYTWDDPGYATDSNISLIALSGQVGRWQSGTTPDFLNFGQSDLGSRDGYWGPNVFVGDPVFATPEPTSMALLGLALAGLGAMRRRHRS